MKTYQYALNGPCYPFWKFWYRLFKCGIKPCNWSSRYTSNPIKLKWVLYSIKTMILRHY